MAARFTIEYWIDDKWYVGRLKEVPGVISQGRSLKELELNIKDAYVLMMDVKQTKLPKKYKKSEKEIVM